MNGTGTSPLGRRSGIRFGLREQVVFRLIGLWLLVAPKSGACYLASIVEATDAIVDRRVA